MEQVEENEIGIARKDIRDMWLSGGVGGGGVGGCKSIWVV